MRCSAALAPQLTGKLVREGLVAAQAIENEGARARVLVAMAPQLTGKLVGDGLVAAQTIENERSRARVLVAMAPQLTGKLVRDGLAAAQEIENEGFRSDALVALAPQLTGELLREGLTTVQTDRPVKGTRCRSPGCVSPAVNGRAAEGGAERWRRRSIISGLARMPWRPWYRC